MRGRPLRLTASLLAVAAVTGCSGIASESAGTVTQAPTDAPPQAATRTPTAGVVSTTSVTPSGSASDSATPEIDSTTTPPAGRADPAAVSRALEPVRAEFGSRLAVAWGPVGAPEQVQVVGATRDIDSWSTIKAAIGLAVAQNADGDLSANQRDLMTDMLTISDNDAAKTLWDSLGDPDDRVTKVFRSTGDATTRAGRDADGDPVSFGLTAWQPADAARFATMLPCADEADVVLDYLAQVTPEQQWGLGTVAGSRFKGGWGPSDHGYLARQVGVIPRADDTWVGVAIAVQPDDGTHESAIDAVDDATRILVSLLGADDSGSCPTG